MDAEAVADRLYGLPPEEFTSARNASEKDAKAAGDKDLAAQIHRLAKPNQVAWLANQLAREHAGEIAPLVELGAELRDATDGLDGDQLRALSRQRQQLVYALVQQARRLAAAAGKKVSEDTARGLQETLQAALADPDAAERLVAGRLTEGLQYAGFGPPAGAGTRSPPAAPQNHRESVARPAGDRHAEELVRAERDLERATAAAEDAGEARDEAQAELDEADVEVSRLDTEVTRLRAELDRTVDELSRAERDKRRARDKLGRASQKAKEAERLLEEAERRRRRLNDED